MAIAREGAREIILGTLLLAVVAAGAGWLWWPLALAPAALWVWLILFFRDPRRVRDYAPGDLCSPADGTVTEITALANHDAIGGPVVRIGIFLSLFNVHINRMPCAGRVRKVDYRKGEFLDARHPQSGERNESNTLLIDPDAPMPGPIVVRQVAGLVARRIICHLNPGDSMGIGGRFGLIKFGSRTELIIPQQPGTEVLVRLGDKVQGGLTVLARQPVAAGTDQRATVMRGERPAATIVQAAAEQ